MVTYEVYGRVTLVPGKGRINEVTAQFRTKQEREEWSGHLAEHFSVPKEHIQTHIIFREYLFYFPFLLSVLW